MSQDVNKDLVSKAELDAVVENKNRILEEKKEQEAQLMTLKKQVQNLTKAIGLESADDIDTKVSEILKQKEKERLESMTEAERVKHELEERLNNTTSELKTLKSNLENEQKAKNELALETKIKNELSKEIVADRIDFVFKAMKVDIQSDENGYFAIVDDKRVDPIEYAKAYANQFPELKPTNQKGGGGSPRGGSKGQSISEYFNTGKRDDVLTGLQLARKK